MPVIRLPRMGPEKCRCQGNEHAHHSDFQNNDSGRKIRGLFDSDDQNRGDYPNDDETDVVVLQLHGMPEQSEI